MPYRVPSHIVEQTFSCFRACGKGQRECQVLWVSSWDSPLTISHAIHPQHAAHAGGFTVNDEWLNRFWLALADNNEGIRVQVHTHPGEAFHSSVDDTFPAVHTPGFLSLVIPTFALGPVGFHDAYLAELEKTGKWRRVPIATNLEVIA